MDSRRAASWLAAAGLIALGAYHVLLTAWTVAFYGLDHPFQDQHRLNYRYLTEPFLQAVLGLENGHRPVFPGIVRWIELAWLGGTQALQVATSWLAAAFAVSLLAGQAWRDLGSRRALAAAAVCAVSTLLLWTANARMFIHAYEAQHLWYVLAGLVAAVAIAIGAGSRAERWAAAIAACVFATFSFGPGIATFAALFVVALLRGAGVRVLSAITVSAIACFAAYLWLLPGGEGVRAQSSGLQVAAAALFAPARVGAFFAEFVRLLVPADDARLVVAWVAGAAGIAGVATSVLRRARRGEAFTGTDLHAVALVVFSLAANGLIAVNRAAYFQEHGGQLFADRYLFWSCAGWAGIALYGMGRLRFATAGLRAAGIGAVAVVSLLAIKTGHWWNHWSAEVYHLVERGAIVTQLDLRIASRLGELTDGPVENAWRCADAMRRRGVGAFARLPSPPVGWKIGNLARPDEVATLRVTALPDAPSGVFAVRGELPRAVSARRGERNWIAAGDGTVIGAGAFTFHPQPKDNRFRLRRPLRDGFEGIVAREGEAQWLVAERDGAFRAIARLTLEGRR